MTQRILHTILLIQLSELDRVTGLIFPSDDEEADYPLDDEVESMQPSEEESEESHSTPMTIDDWEGDYYLDNNRLSNDILVRSYFALLGLDDTDLFADLLDEDRVISFNNGTFAGEDDMGDPLDVPTSSN